MYRRLFLFVCGGGCSRRVERVGVFPVFCAGLSAAFLAAACGVN